MGRRALLVIDMLDDFIRPGGKLYCGPKAEAIVPNVAKRIEEYDATGDPVIFVCDNHDPDDKEFERFPPHCVVGTKGAEIVSELGFNPTKHTLVPKKRFSGFYGTNLDTVLFVRFGAAPEFNKKTGTMEHPEAGKTLVEACGVLTSICVMDTVAGFCYRNFKTSVRRDCVSDLTDEMHKMALDRMAAIYGTEIV